MTHYMSRLRAKTDPINHETGRCKSIFCRILSRQSAISKSQNKTIKIGCLLFILESATAVLGFKIIRFVIALHLYYEKSTIYFEPLFQRSSNILLPQFHFYEKVLGW